MDTHSTLRDHRPWRPRIFKGLRRVRNNDKNQNEEKPESSENGKSEYEKPNQHPNPESITKLSGPVSWSNDMGTAGGAMEDSLFAVIGDVGRAAPGMVAVEVWTLNGNKTSLFRPDGGLWVDPGFLETKMSRALEKFVFEVPSPVTPGCGLAGVLWTEAPRVKKSSSRKGTARSRPERKVVWRNIQSTALDPDQPFDPRLKLTAEAGFGLVAGVPFNADGYQGIVLFLTSRSSGIKELNSQHNEAQLVSATDTISAKLGEKMGKHQR